MNLKSLNNLDYKIFNFTEQFINLIKKGNSQQCITAICWRQFASLVSADN